MKTVLAGDQLISSKIFRSQEFTGTDDKIQYYLNENVTFHDGIMDILARSNYKGHTYTAGRVTTKAMKDFGYGVYSFTLKLPWTTGSWCGPWAATNEPTWPLYPELDICEANKRGEKGLCSSGFICNQPPGIKLDLAKEFKMSEYGADPDAWNTWTMEITDTKLIYSVNHVIYRTIERSQLDLHRRTVWGTPFFFLIDYQIGKSWAGIPNTADYLEPKHLLCSEVILDEAPISVQIPPTPLPENPTPPQGGQMKVDLVGSVETDHPKLGLAWQLQFQVTDAVLGSDLKLYVSGQSWIKPGSFVSLKGIYVPRTWPSVTYWLGDAQGNELTEKIKDFFHSPPLPEIPTEPDPITPAEKIKARAIVLRAQANLLDEIANSLDG